MKKKMCKPMMCKNCSHAKDFKWMMLKCALDGKDQYIGDCCTMHERKRRSKKAISSPDKRFAVGSKISLRKGDYLEVMAFVSNYYMARYKYCVPFLCDLKKLKQIIKKETK
jgi:hypothetical protein